MRRRGHALFALILLPVVFATAASPSLADVSAPPIVSVVPSYPADTFLLASSRTYVHLECNAGSWQSATPVTLAISWVRNGVAIANTPSFDVEPADVMLGVPVCQVTATNVGGQTTVTLGAVPTFPTDPLVPAYAVFGGTLIVHVERDGRAVVPISCTTAGTSGCSGTVTVQRGSTQMGSGTFSIATVAKGRGLVTLTPRARALLATHRLLDATLMVHNASGAYAADTIVLDGRALARPR
jgi:hypothetical protein